MVNRDGRWKVCKIVGIIEEGEKGRWIGVEGVLKKFPSKTNENNWNRANKANFFLKGICTLGNVLTYQATFVKTSQKSRYTVLRETGKFVLYAIWLAIVS